MRLLACVLAGTAAALALAALGVAFWAGRVEAGLYPRLALFDLHETLGFAAVAAGLAGALCAFGIRLERPAQAAVRVAGGLLAAVAASGWIAVSASERWELYGLDPRPFGLFVLPDPVSPASPAAEAAALGVHLATSLALLVALAAAGIALALRLRRRKPLPG